MNYGVSGATVKQAKLGTPAGNPATITQIAYAEIKDTTTNTTTTAL